MMYSEYSRRLPSLLLAASGLAASAHAQTLPTVVYCNIAGAPASTTGIHVPTRNVQTFNSAPFDGLHRSPNGERFILIANTTDATTSNRIIIAGTTNPASGTVIVRKGESIPNYTTRTINLLDKARINDAGQFAFSTNTGGSGTLSLFFLFGETVPAVSYGYVAASTESVPGLSGWTFSGGISSTLLDNLGQWGFQTGLNDGSGTRAAVYHDGQIIALVNDSATAPVMLPMRPAALWGGFLLQRVFVDASGTNFAWIGAPNGLTSDVFAVNNTVIAEEGQPLPLNGQTVGFTNACWQDSSGAWYLRGEFGSTTASATNTDFILRNNVIVARRGDPIIPGSTLTWDRSVATTNGFQQNVGAGGHYFIAGATLDTSTSAVSVAGVLDGQTIVIRRGDPIDVDGDALADDDAFLMGFVTETGAGKAFLTDSGQLWMEVTVQNGAGTGIGRAIVRMQLTLSTPCPVDFDDNGTVQVQDIFDFLNAWFMGNPAADFNGGGLSVSDIFDFLNAWFAGCP